MSPTVFWWWDLCCLSNFGGSAISKDMPESVVTFIRDIKIYLDPVRFLEIESIETIESDIHNLLIELIWINRIITYLYELIGSSWSSCHFLGSLDIMDSPWIQHGHVSGHAAQEAVRYMEPGRLRNHSWIVEIHSWASEHFNMINWLKNIKDLSHCISSFVRCVLSYESYESYILDFPSLVDCSPQISLVICCPKQGEWSSTPCVHVSSCILAWTQ